MNSQALTDGYVECDECGHPIEGHLDDCNEIEGCPCPVRWTVEGIKAARRREGLPAGNPRTWLLLEP